MNLTDLFPNLTGENHEIISPRTVRYNCIAWAACNTERWWQPGVFWPVDSSRDDHGVGNVVEAFRSLGYEECDDGALEGGFEKLALYGSTMMYTHAARQLPDGKWTSKLGQLQDITHTTTEAIEGGDHGEVVEVSGSGVSGIYKKESQYLAEQLLVRIINQNEQARGVFYLHQDADVGIATPSVALLRVTFALRR